MSVPPQLPLLGVLACQIVSVIAPAFGPARLGLVANESSATRTLLQMFTGTRRVW